MEYKCLCSEEGYFCCRLLFFHDVSFGDSVEIKIACLGELAVAGSSASLIGKRGNLRTHT